MTQQSHHRILLMSLLCLTIFMINIEYSAINLIIPSICKSLHINEGGAHWIIVSYLLSMGAVIVAGGKLGDIFARDKIFALSLIAFTVTSVGVGYSHSFSILILYRIVQGISAGILWPNVIAIGYQAYPANQKGFTSGLMTSTIGLSIAAGPLIGLYFTHYFSWRYIFLINIPIVLIILLLLPSAFRSISG